MSVYCNNKSVIGLAHNSVSTTKYVDIDLHFIVEKLALSPLYCPTWDSFHFTKGLPTTMISNGIYSFTNLRVLSRRKYFVQLHEVCVVITSVVQ